MKKGYTPRWAYFNSDEVFIDAKGGRPLATDPTETKRGPGRWRTGQQSRQRIVDAARALFAQQGYHSTTIRSVAEQAQVDPAMIHYFFGTKQGLFSAAVRLPGNPVVPITELLEDGLDGVGSRMLDRFLAIWDSADNLEPLAAMTRSGPGGDASSLLSEFIDHEVTARLVLAIERDDAPLRGSLVTTQLTGLIVNRYLVPIEPLASAPRETIVRWLGPILQQLLTGAGPTAG